MVIYWLMLGRFHYIGVNYEVFEGWQSIAEVFCDTIQSFNEITQDLINIDHFHTTTSNNNKRQWYTNNLLQHTHVTTSFYGSYSVLYCIFNRIWRSGSSYEQWLLMHAVTFATTPNSAPETRLPRFSVSLHDFSHLQWSTDEHALLTFSTQLIWVDVMLL